MVVRELGRVVAGRTAPVVLYLQEAGEDISGTGYTLTDVLITGVDGRPVATAGKFSWDDQAAGAVSYAPAAGDFVAEKSPYRVRVQLTDGAGKTRFYPETFTATIVVLPQR